MTGGAQDSGVDNITLVSRLRNPPFGTETSERLLMSAAADAIEALTRATPAPAGWRPIETCDTWRFDHMTPMIAYWPTRGPRETYYDVDEEFHRRPKGWASPEEGWRSPGDQCIPIESHQPTHWREFPAAPTAPAEGGA